MKILQVIHGYPMRYNAGSEVYTQTLSQGLAERHEVHVFTREEDSFAPDFRLRVEHDPDDSRVTLHIVNNPRLRDRYRHAGIDQKFAAVLDEIKPDIVHVGHLNHLSTSMLIEASARHIPIVYTLHDYWVMCPRGQFMQMHPRDDEPAELWAACDGQDDRKCAERCYARYFSGAEVEYESDVSYWTDWVSRRMQHIREVVDIIDVFIAPANYLLQRYRDEFGMSERKLTYLDYGFDLGRMKNRVRYPGEPFTFGYIGTHIPSKGIHQLINAFGMLKGIARLKIWGKPKGQDTDALKGLAKNLPVDVFNRIEWLSEYRNQEIVEDVFNHIDAIVVPSIWVENSPLVIHEAQQVRVPVITADVGGMAEYVHHEVNGLLFKHRSIEQLSAQMQRFVDKPSYAAKLGDRGYIFSENGDIPDIQSHVQEIVKLYAQVLKRKEPQQAVNSEGPWRITFDTNPDTCNLKCIMCEEHSPHSKLQVIRKIGGKQHRIMPIDLLRRVVRDAVPHGLREIIPSTMGEPLLYKDFGSIIDLCHEEGVLLNLTTNGTFPGIGARAWAERIVPITSDVKISWNGATKTTHESIMLGADFDEMLSNARLFIEVRDDHAKIGGNRCRVTFQLTFLEDNVAELADIVRLAIGLGVDRIKGHHLWAHFGEIEELSMRRNADAIQRWNTAVTKARKVAMDHRLPNGQHILLDNLNTLDTNASDNIVPGGVCPFLGQEAWVSAAGRFDPCCAPDVQRRTLGEFGYLHEHNLMDIWTGHAYQELKKSYLERSLCQGCNMRKSPMGQL